MTIVDYYVGGSNIVEKRRISEYEIGSK